ncbi:MAG: hypothetical protein HQL53_10125, partial [Magnetococcales bacterium]|nr:hypothetical protein [Magnetococcales bacterium]
MNDLLQSRAGQIAALILWSAVLMIFTDIILDPFESRFYVERIILDSNAGMQSALHPFYSPEFFSLYGFKLFPDTWFFSAFFHLLAGLAMHVAVLGLLAKLLMRAGWSFWEGLFGGAFVVAFGHGVLSWTLGFPALSPAPQHLYAYYDPRSGVVPL